MHLIHLLVCIHLHIYITLYSFQRCTRHCSVLPVRARLAVATVEAPRGQLIAGQVSRAPTHIWHTRVRGITRVIRHHAAAVPALREGETNTRYRHAYQGYPDRSLERLQPQAAEELKCLSSTRDRHFKISI